MAENQYEFIKKRLAPCGLHCGRCFAFTDGDVLCRGEKPFQILNYKNMELTNKRKRIDSELKMDAYPF